MKKIIIILIFTGFIFSVSLIFLNCSKKDDLPVLHGPYLGQKPPGLMPEIFAPGTISSPEHEHSYPSFSHDGKKVLWTVMFTRLNIELPPMILTMDQENNQWTRPKIADFSGVFPDGEGCLSPNNKKFFFGSQRPFGKENKPKKDLDIWYVEKIASQWSNPVRLNSLINTDKHEMQPSISANGNLYYVGHFEKGRNNNGIYRSIWENGKFQKPELLGTNVNSEEFQWTPYIAPDESYLMFSGFRKGGFGSGDIYICFRKSDDTFGKPVNLGQHINTEMNERFPCISPDGKYLFYVSDKFNYRHDRNNPNTYDQIVEISNSPGNGYCDIYWVDAKIIEDLNPNIRK